MPLFSTAGSRAGRPGRPWTRRGSAPGGFQAFEHFWAIPAAVELQEAIGPARVRERILALNGRLREELARMPRVRLRTPKGPSLAAGITAFEVDGLSPAEVVRKLRAQKVLASSSP